MPDPKKKARKAKTPRPPKPDKKPVYTTVNGTPIIPGKAG
jgi:hypothetical protein